MSVAREKAHKKFWLFFRTIVINNSYSSRTRRIWTDIYSQRGRRPSWLLGSLSTRVFGTRTATGREHFTCQDSGVSQIFVLIISNGEKIPSNVNVVVWKQVKRENSSLPVAVRVSKTCMLKLPVISSYPASPRRITVLVNFQAILLIFSGETSSNRDIFFTEDAAKNFFRPPKFQHKKFAISFSLFGQT